jgi:hypothetical protein
MDLETKGANTELQVQPISIQHATAGLKPEDAAIEELGHRAALPRTLTSRLGIIGTISTVVCPWPSALSVAPLCLSNGGSGGLLIGFVISTVFMTLVYYLIAEKLRLYAAFLRWFGQHADLESTELPLPADSTT